MNSIDLDALNPNIAVTADERLSAYRWSMAALGCLGLAFWMLIHPYRGLEHDSVLYAVLALARLHPAALGHDLFVRYGTQNDFTVFSPIFATAIRTFGLEPGAAILTFVTHVGFIAATWLVARRLMAPRIALLATSLVMVMPALYGSHSVFSYFEAFLTPRQSAEACVLAGLAAALASRQILAGLCMAGAVLLHPIIAAAGITAWIILVPGLARPRAALVITAVLTVTLVGLSLTGIGPFRHFDAFWLTVLRDRLAYLFPSEWSLTEWTNTAVHAAVLGVGVGFGRDPRLRRLCLAVLITVVLGMLFAVVESDGLHVIVAAQLQAWRWLWLLGVMSVLLLAPIAVDCWQSGDLGRATALLMLGALLIRPDEPSVVPAALACLAALGRARIRPPQAKMLLMLAVVLLVAALGLLISDIVKLLPGLQAIRSQKLPYMVRIGEAQALAYGGILPAAVLALVCFSVPRATLRSARLAALLGGALLVSVLPYSMLTWSQAQFPQDRARAFAPWRAAIPESAEVLWPDQPQAAWFELGRASYWSLYQMAGLVFSHDVTVLSTRREEAVTPILPQLGRKLISDKHYALADAPKVATAHGGGPCDLPGVTYYASWINRGPTPYPVVTPDLARPKESVYLYRCGHDSH